MAKNGAGAQATANDPDCGTNEVLLVGRLGAAATVKTLPSGDDVVMFRVVTRRLKAARRQGRDRRDGPQVDTLDCVAWRADVRKSVCIWQAGDVIEVSGALRRRFWRDSARGAASRVEVEVTRVRRLRRAE